jgi:putative DNA primase/helicase
VEEQDLTCAEARSVSALGRAALEYAARGWPVLPCRTDKRPYTEHGFKDATCDAALISGWWQRWPSASIGIATGAAGLVVIDVDVKNGAPGEQSWQALLSDCGEELSETAIVATPSGGRHLYYRAPKQPIACSASSLASGIDVRAAGGYVIAPPSRGAGGAAYEWLEGSGAERVRELPHALAARLTSITKPVAGGSEAGDVLSAGERNNGLTSLAGRLRKSGLSQQAIEASLTVENAQRCQPALPEAEVRGIAASVARYSPGQAPGARPARGSDTDNAERLIAMFGEQLRYCALEKLWYVYDGRRWARDELLRVEEFMRQALLSVFADAARAGSDDEAKSAGRLGARLQSAQARRAALQCARSDPRIAVHPTEFDLHPWLLNCLNGTIDLRSGELRPHAAGDMIRQLAPVEFDAQARHEVWERFLEDVTGGDRDLRGYLQRAAGYSLTGDTGERVFFLLLGPTTTGKSTFIESLAAAAGDYARATGIEAFLRRGAVGGARPDIAALVGRRLVTGVEVDEQRHLDAVLIKQMVGGDTIAERGLYVDAVPFVPQCKLWFAANDAPRMSDTDDALWVRACEIPFRHQVPEERKDPEVKAVLRDPARAGAAILAWAVHGCRAWQDQGLGTALKVRQATQELRRSMDPLADFLDECCCFEPASFTSNSELRAAYREWLAGGDDNLGDKGWGVRLQARGLQRDKERSARGYRGIRLRESARANAGGQAGAGTERTVGQ